MDDRIRRIVDGDVVASICIFPPDRGGIAGSLLDTNMRAIWSDTGLTLWTAATLEDLLVKLEEWADGARRRLTSRRQDETPATTSATVAVRRPSRGL